MINSNRCGIKPPRKQYVRGQKVLLFTRTEEGMEQLIAPGQGGQVRRAKVGAAGPRDRIRCRDVHHLRPGGQPATRNSAVELMHVAQHRLDIEAGAVGVGEARVFQRLVRVIGNWCQGSVGAHQPNR